MSNNKIEIAVAIVTTVLLVAAKVYLIPKKENKDTYLDKMSRVAYAETKIKKIQDAAKRAGVYGSTAYNTFVMHSLVNATSLLETYMLYGAIGHYEYALKNIHKAEKDLAFFCRVSV